jgi:ribosomal protein L11 methyltransferase
MDWIELSVATDSEGAEAAAALLNQYVAAGAVIEETLITDAGEIVDPARAFTVRAFFSAADAAAVERAEQALWHLGRLRSMSDPQTRVLAEEDWAEAWKKHYTTLHIGRSLVIKPSWLDYAPEPGEHVVELDPGMAFGTGLHPTTRLCMVALEQRVQPGMRLIDVGTGSGILSITAARLGAAEVAALDTDPIAVESAARSVAINHVESIVHVRLGSIALASPQTAAEPTPASTRTADTGRNLFDIACINILAEVICELAPAVASVLRLGGIVIASGILDFKADDVVDAFAAVGI